MAAMNKVLGWRCGRQVRLTMWLALAAWLPAAAHAESVEEKAQVCAACHGENGVPVEQSFLVPVVWGQQLGYLFFELRDFKSGARKSDLMTPIAQGLEQADLMALAEYFSKKPWPDLQQKPSSAEDAAEAQRVNASVVCTSCHQEGFKGSGTQPRLAGQVRAYLQKTMLDFRSGERANNPGMTGFVKGLTEQEIAAVAAWLAGM